jgi:hypothetical protein
MVPGPGVEKPSAMAFDYPILSPRHFDGSDRKQPDGPVLLWASANVPYR